MVMPVDSPAAFAYEYHRGSNKRFEWSGVVDLFMVKNLCLTLRQAKVIPDDLNDWAGNVILDASANNGRFTHAFIKSLVISSVSGMNPAKIEVVINDISYVIKNVSQPLEIEVDQTISEMQANSDLSGFNFRRLDKNYLDVKSADLSGKQGKLIIDRLGAAWHMRKWKEVEQYFEVGRELLDLGGSIIVDAFNAQKKPQGIGDNYSTYQHLAYNFVEEAETSRFNQWLFDKYGFSTNIYELSGAEIIKRDRAICVWRRER